MEPPNKDLKAQLLEKLSLEEYDEYQKLLSLRMANDPALPFTGEKRLRVLQDKLNQKSLLKSLWSYVGWSGLTYATMCLVVYRILDFSWLWTSICFGATMIAFGLGRWMVRERN